MKRIRPYPFDRVTRLARAQVDAGRALLAHLPLDAGPHFAEVEAALGGPVVLRLVEAYAFPVRELGQRLGGGVLLRLSGPAGREALLAIDPALAPRLARRALGADTVELPAPRPLGPAEQGALAFLATALLDGQPLRVEEVIADRLDPWRRAAGGSEPLDGSDLRARFPDPWVLALEARIESPVGTGWARLLAPDRIRLALPPPRGLGSLASHLPRLAAARVSLRMEVGRTRIGRVEFAHLQPGDVVLFDRFGPRPPFGGPMSLRLGHGGFSAHLGGDGLTILGPFQLGDPPMPIDDQLPPARLPRDDASDEATADALLRELPVEAVCELGRVTLTGRELLELRPGAVIPVGRPLAGPVDLTVGGRIVARGELVDVEGEIGVRITQLSD